MKLRLTILCAAVILAVSVIFCAGTVFANGENAYLSPAIEILAANEGMIKTGIEGIVFTAVDFDNALGVSEVETVTISTLPDADDGILVSGGLTIAEGQTLSRSALNMLEFKPSADCESGEFTFTYSCGSGSCKNAAVTCSLKVIGTYNYAPTATFSSSGALETWTHTGISAYGTLDGSDPEGDGILFEISSPPKKGDVVIVDAASGDYRYTPYISASGTDSFSYTVRDEYGNYSTKRTVTVSIEKLNSDVIFTDMEGHWAQNAALVMAEHNVMTGAATAEGVSFMPDEEISRVDFLVTTMKLLGAENLPEIASSGFDDDEDIPTSAKAYAAAAYRLGIISGDTSSGGRCFRPNDTVTRAEAAAILNNIIGADVPAAVPVFADFDDTVPAWAENALYALNSIGVISGTGSGTMSPFAAMTRAETAQLLTQVLRYAG